MTEVRLRRNLTFLYGAEILGKILAIAVFGYLGRVLGRDRYGDLEFALGVIFIFNLVLDAGLAPYGAREASRHPERAARLAAQIGVIRVGLFFLSAMAIIFIVGIASKYRDETACQLLLYYTLVLLPLPLQLNWAFEARGEMEVVAASSFLRQAVLAVGVFALVRSPETVARVPVIDATGLLITVLVQHVLFRRRVGKITLTDAVDGLRRVIGESLPLAISAVIWALRLFAPLLAIWIFSGAGKAGDFGAAHRLAIALHAFVWLYFVNLLPSLSRLAGQNDAAGFRRMVKASLGLVAVVSVVGASLAWPLKTWIITLVYGDELSGAAVPFAVLAWMLAVTFVSGHFRYGLIAMRRPGDELMASIAGCVISLLGCLVMRGELDPVDGAVILVAAEITTLFVAWALCRRATGQKLVSE